jgi:hypothetical protein
MDEGSSALWQELSELADAYADLGRRLLHASRQLHAPGALPPESLGGELAALRGSFQGVRERACGLAEGLGVAYPGDGSIDNLRSLARLLEAMGEAEVRRDEWEVPARRASGMLEQVLRLRYAVADDDAPLLACQAAARDLLRAASSGPDDTIAGTLRALADLNHPFASLLAMAGGAGGISDEAWENHFDSVAAAFGPALAASAARGRVVEAPAEAVEPAGALEPQAEPVPDGAMVLPFRVVRPGEAESPLPLLVDEVLTSVADEAQALRSPGVAAVALLRKLGRAVRRPHAAEPSLSPAGDRRFHLP